MVERAVLPRWCLMVIFLLCWVYWAWLIHTTQMHVVYDAVGYEDSARSVFEHGWRAYFQALNREPLYAFSIALSMKIAGHFHVSYQLVQKIFQVFCLFMAQLLLWLILRRMNIHRALQAVLLIYFGFSPALLNASLSLFSEIIVIPTVLLSLWLCFLSWQMVLREGNAGALRWGALTGLSFLLVALAKGVFIFVFIGMLAHFLWACVHFARLNDRPRRKKCARFMVAGAIVFFSGIAAIVGLNEKYNGHWQYTSRYTLILFGSAYKRTQPLTPRILMAHLASIPGKGVCRRFFSEEECVYCEAYSADYFAETVLQDKLKGVPSSQMDSKTLELTVHQMATNPLQYVLFMFYEFLRMPFWESTQIGFVYYPQPLSRLYDAGCFKDGLRLLVSLMTLAALVFCAGALFRSGPFMFDNAPRAQNLQMDYFLVLIIGLYTISFSFAFVLTRYALPIVPLYFLCAALFFQGIVNSTRGKK